MHFKDRYKSRFLKFFPAIFLFLSAIYAQHYFSPVLPVGSLPVDARSLAMGGTGINNTRLQPAFGDFGYLFRISLDLEARATRETRSFPVIDMFDDVVTQNAYVVNRPVFYSVPWSIGTDITKWLKLPVSLSVSQSPTWDFRYDYQEEVRASLGSGVYNRDPVAGYHIFRMKGFIQSTSFNIALRPLAKVQLGLNVEMLSGSDLSQEIGVHVLQADDALAADSTTITQYDFSVGQSSRFSYGILFSPSKSLTLGVSMKSEVDVSFTTDGYVPILHERTQLPGFVLADTVSNYSIVLPSEIGFGFSARLRNKIKTQVNGHFIYSDWSQVDQVIVNASSIDTVNFQYEPAWFAHIGLEQWILNKTPFRFGFMYLGSPLGNEFERTIITFGTGWTYHGVTLDIAAAVDGLDYQYFDLFVPEGQDATDLEMVKESTLMVKASIMYSF